MGFSFAKDADIFPKANKSPLKMNGWRKILLSCFRERERERERERVGVTHVRYILPK